MLQRAIDRDHVAAQRLLKMSIAFERNDRRLVLARPQDAFNELAGGSFLLRQGVFFRNTDVEQEGDRQRTISLSLKSKERLRYTVFEDAQIGLLKICEVAIVLVGDGEEEVREIGLGADHIHILPWSLCLRGQGERACKTKTESENCKVKIAN